VAMFF